MALLNPARNQSLDFLRGITIIMMVVFHFSFDLNYFHIVDIDIRHDAFWYYFRRVIVTLFVFIMGYSLVLAYQNSIRLSRVFKRFGQLLGLAMLITLSTYFIFEHSWIYFGILHFMAFATIIGVWFVKKPWIALVLGVTIYVGYYGFDITMYPWLQSIKPLLGLPQRTEDLVLFLPWLAPMFIGIFFAHKMPIRSIVIPKRLRWINIAGQHPLFIYMVHQPILFSIAFLLSLLHT